MERTNNKSMTEQLVERTTKKRKSKKGYSGPVISTGSTLLDLAISGGIMRGGGVIGGIFIEAFGPSGSGKTVLLASLAGNVQRQGGDAMFADPEARINKQFASMFGFELKDYDYHRPDTVTELFKLARKWEPKGEKGSINGIFADSLAALSTDMEMDNEDGDKMGMRRAKEFSEQLRKFCRILAQENYIMACSNQIRENADAGPYGQKYTTPGGKAVEFYASLRLRFQSPSKIYDKIKVKGQEIKKAIGTEVMVEVVKSSIDKPFRTAPINIIFDYGIDDIRANLQFIKKYSGQSVYTCGGEKLDKSLKDSILIIEENELEQDLRNEVIDLWEALEKKFDSNRKPRF